MRVALILQFLVVIGSGFVLDEGLFAQISLMALPPFWAAAILLIWRRPQQPTRFDLSFIRIGYLHVLVLTLFLAEYIWHFRGVG